jgi:hypothetical protein
MTVGGGRRPAASPVPTVSAVRGNGSGSARRAARASAGSTRS